MYTEEYVWVITQIYFSLRRKEIINFKSATIKDEENPTTQSDFKTCFQKINFSGVSWSSLASEFRLPCSYIVYYGYRYAVKGELKGMYFRQEQLFLCK